MSTFSKNLFDVLGDGEVPRPAAPVKEEAAPVVIDKKNVAKINKDAARASKGGKPTKGRQQKEGRPQRGRQFDRHSGTGIVDTEKKINKGWGKAGTSEAEGAKDTLSPADPDAPEQEVADAPVQEEEKVKTLDEYLAEKANKSLKVSLPEARKANDNDESAFKGTVAFSKEEFEEFYVSKETKTVKKTTTEKTRKEKVFVDIEQRFQEKPRAEFRKNDRRGRANNNNKGRRGPKGSNNGPAVNLQDVTAFPTLGATA
ncbi:uncharacterized protein B0P05DRAFT_565624 [Gilbertella persicaria]|uniref:uncharacterized protein n=1 Tax=Gilbertella persicaria TaxID=101096 RepID=UPI002220BA16|nr:uncharacterized protein B0P05DRAFT_565624 [Gilbertella persicaria]KAI8047559.1 hypothetical protein B0P05DRAFT_565624 [Gilbertella persicaria]